MPSSLTSGLLVALLSGLAMSSALPHEYPKQKPQHEDHYHHEHHGTPGCGRWHRGVDKLETIKITSSGSDREFSVYLPINYDKHHPTSMLLSFHGRDMNSEEHAALTYFNHSEINPDMIAVFPQAIDCLWQDSPHAKNMSDKHFTTDIIHYMRDNYCLDNRRFYAAGFDIGGGFVANLACSPHHDSDFAAFAIVSPEMSHEASWCNTASLSPILIVEGISVGRKKHAWSSTEADFHTTGLSSVVDVLTKLIISFFARHHNRLA